MGRQTAQLAPLQTVQHTKASEWDIYYYIHTHTEHTSWKFNAAITPQNATASPDVIESKNLGPDGMGVGWVVSY